MRPERWNFCCGKCKHKHPASKAKIAVGQESMLCPDCQELGSFFQQFGWQDEDRTVIEVERVYETRIDCQSVPREAGGKNYSASSTT